MAVYNSGRGERVVSAGIGVGMPSSRREIEEDILEELCHMAQRRSCLGVGDISEVLKISEKELSYYLRQMKRHGYVELSPEETSVCLTELGRITGAECGYRHEIFAQFLQFVGVGSETAREDACRMEHIVSEETVRQVCNFVNYGETFERVLRYTDLSYRYAPGDYVFLMGIYYMEKRIPAGSRGNFMIFPRISGFMSRKKKAGLSLRSIRSRTVIWAVSGTKISKNGSVRNLMYRKLWQPYSALQEVPRNCTTGFWVPSCTRSIWTAS